jgi:hypothetical protein
MTNPWGVNKLAGPNQQGTSHLAGDPGIPESLTMVGRPPS